MNTIQWLIPVLVAYAALTQVVQDWYYSLDLDYAEGCELPHRRWVCWGTCRALNRAYAADFRYFYFRLPFLHWERSYAYDRDGFREGWHQHAFLRFNGKWRHWMQPCDDVRYVTAIEARR